MQHTSILKRAIVVGASSGIGRELAILLAKDNYLVGITGRRGYLLEEIRLLNPENIIVSIFDNDDIAHLEDNLQNLTKKIGGIDLLVISAGTGDLNEALDFAVEANTILLNVTAFTKIADWAINYFIKQGNGHLVGISSVAGLVSSYMAPAYNASKAYQINYLAGLRKKMGGLKLPMYITDARPGFVDTAMAKGPGKFWVAPAAKAGAQIWSAIKNKRKVVYITKRWRIVAMLAPLLG